MWYLYFDFDIEIPNIILFWNPYKFKCTIYKIFHYGNKQKGKKFTKFRFWVNFYLDRGSKIIYNLTYNYWRALIRVERTYPEIRNFILKYIKISKSQEKITKMMSLKEACRSWIWTIEIREKYVLSSRRSWCPSNSRQPICGQRSQVKYIIEKLKSASGINILTAFAE